MCVYLCVYGSERHANAHPNIYTLVTHFAHLVLCGNLSMLEGNLVLAPYMVLVREIIAPRCCTRRTKIKVPGVRLGERER